MQMLHETILMMRFLLHQKDKFGRRALQNYLLLQYRRQTCDMRGINMKVVILAGGLPSMLYDSFEMVPKPMAEIGGRPILWHIMKHYAAYGYNDFIICTGYKGNIVKDYFMNYYIYQSDITVNLQTNEVHIHKKKTEDWKVTVVDTGLYTAVSDRILQLREYLLEDSFIVNYGDCVSDIDVEAVVRCHKAHKMPATMVMTMPSGRNRALPVDGNGRLVTDFCRIPRDTWVDACMLVFRRKIFDYLRSDVELLRPPLFEKLLSKEQLSLYYHNGFWAPMETKRDQGELETMWKEDRAPWKNWND